MLLQRLPLNSPELKYSILYIINTTRQSLTLELQSKKHETEWGKNMRKEKSKFKHDFTKEINSSYIPCKISKWHRNCLEKRKNPELLKCQRIWKMDRKALLSIWLWFFFLVFCFFFCFLAVCWGCGDLMIVQRRVQVCISEDWSEKCRTSTRTKLWDESQQPCWQNEHIIKF